MSIDAVALLRIPQLVAPRDLFRGARAVEHRADASLINTMIKFEGTSTDEHALYLRKYLGDALNAHDDPRGIFFFPDVCEPKSQSYDAIIEELAEVGRWAPVVTLAHVPAKYAAAPRGSHEAMVGQLIHALGRDEATQLDLMAQVHAQLAALPNQAGAAEEFERAIEQVTAALGAAFADEYRASVRREVERQASAQAARAARFAAFAKFADGRAPTDPEDEG